MAVDSATAIDDQRQMLQVWTVVLWMYHACHLVLVAQEAVEIEHRQSLPGEGENLEVVEEGVEHLENGEDDRAIECFTEGVRINPECARANRLRGHICRETGKWA